ncbi:MAG TPA: helix-turn-helix transcriptional regulator, partial [Anaerolineae bacterium]
MSDLAQRLREARDRMGISMEDAERATKIRRRYIEAIEAGDFGRLPDGPPARGFIKNYARYLGLDADQSLNDFETEVGVPITQLSEVIPPPPGRQQSISRYTQLVKLPPGHQKPNAPVDGQPDENGRSPEDNGGVRT